MNVAIAEVADEQHLDILGCVISRPECPLAVINLAIGDRSLNRGHFSRMVEVAVHEEGVRLRREREAQEREAREAQAREVAARRAAEAAQREEAMRRAREQEAARAAQEKAAKDYYAWSRCCWQNYSSVFVETRRGRHDNPDNRFQCRAGGL